MQLAGGRETTNKQSQLSTTENTLDVGILTIAFQERRICSLEFKIGIEAASEENLQYAVYWCIFGILL